MICVFFLSLASGIAAQFDTLSVGSQRYVQINEEKALQIIDFQETTISTLLYSTDSLFTVLATANDSIATLGGVLATANDSITTLGSVLTTANDSITTLGSVLTTANDSIATLGSALTTANDSIATLGSVLTTASDSIAALGIILTTANDSIATLGGVLATATDSIAELNLGYQELADSLTNLWSVPGCTYPNYLEYNALATWEDGTCAVIAIPGCTDPAYLEYLVGANQDDGSCTTFIIEGCTDYLYGEFNAAANVDDGSCATYLCNSMTYDGYAYDLVQINNQCWFAENLQTTVTSAGTPIPYVTNSTEWSTATGGAQNYANNNTANLASYGRLYNGYAATHSEGLCPIGWHVSSLADWDSLTQFMTEEGYGNFLGIALRDGSDWETQSGSVGTTTLGWDIYGFQALPGGVFTGSSWMYVSRSTTMFWTSNKVSSTRAASKSLVEWETGITHNSSTSFGNGLSIRCVLDLP